MNNTGLKILATGAFLPSIEVENEDFTRIVDTSDEWISKRTGMKKRYLTAGEPTWMMGATAAKQAFQESGLAKEDIDLVLFTTISADFYTPSMACIAAKELELPNAVCFDLNCACSGFVYGLDMAYRYLSTGGARNVLLISAEAISRVLDYTDRATCVLFGDGAGACVITAGQTPFASVLGSDISGTTALYARAPKVTHPFVNDENRVTVDDGFGDKPEKLFMDGKEVYKFATRIMPCAVEQACAKAGIAVNDLAMIIPHQANIRIIETAAQKLKITEDKIYCNVDKYSNTSSATIPLALDELNRAGRLKRGDKLCMVGFGAGLTYGAVVVEW